MSDSPGHLAEAVIEVSGLRMRYGSFEAVRDIDLRDMRGEVFAFLGPNGAGKTTTVEILEGYRRRTGGEVSVLGQDPEPETTTARCATHGLVQATKEIPAMGFPFVVYAARRYLARRRPFRCPTCGAAIDRSSTPARPAL